MLQSSRSVTTADMAVARFVQILRDLAPKDTGNLAFNAIRFEKTGERSWKIYIHTEGEHSPGSLDGIAPYQVYLNDRPTLPNGKPNKHYQWWPTAIELALEEMANLLGGTVEK